MCVGVLPAFVSVPLACPVPVKKRELDALELELQTFVSHNVGARNSTQVLLEEQPVSLTAETSLQTLFSETKFRSQAKLASNSQFSFLNLPRSGITSKRHHAQAWLKIFIKMNKHNKLIVV